MTNLTEQEVFDKVVLHLYHQGKPALNQERACVYRGEDDVMCAVGCLIPEDKYLPNIEGLSISSIVGRAEEGRLISNESVLFNILNDLNLWKHRYLLIALQRAHDGWESVIWNEIETKLREIAKDFKLTFPELSPKEQSECLV